MNSVPCTRCGVSILEATARRNGGLCAPCKSGRRESMEAAKRSSQERREAERTDPFLRLWRQLVHRAYETPDGFAGLSDVEKQYFAVGVLDGEVYNGGFDQYFFNSAGSHYRHAVLGLEAMGAAHSLLLLRRAKELLFDADEVPEDTEVRRTLLRRRTSAARTRRLEALDRQFWSDPDGRAAQIEAFARRHGLL